jgi:alcohol dehydrogenase class IV
MSAYIEEFTLSRLERVLSGPGKTAALGAELDRLQRSRVIVVTGKTLGASPLLARVTDALGPRCAAVFAGGAGG